MTEEEKHQKQLQYMRDWRKRHPGYGMEYYRRDMDRSCAKSRRMYLKRRVSILKNNKEKYHQKKQNFIEMNVVKATEIVKNLKDKIKPEEATAEVIEAIEQLCIIARYAPRWKDAKKRPPIEAGKYLVTYYGGVIVAEMVIVPGAEPMWVSPCVGHVSPERWCYIPVMPKDCSYER